MRSGYSGADLFGEEEEDGHDDHEGVDSARMTGEVE